VLSYRQIGDREIVRTEVRDIEGRETPNPDKEYDYGHIRGGHMDQEHSQEGLRPEGSASTSRSLRV
jgi:hypothetical protein